MSDIVTAQEQTVVPADAYLPGIAAPVSTPSLMQQAVEKGSRLVAAEVQLAKQEIAETVRAGVIALLAGLVAIFGVIAFMVTAVVTVILAVSLHWAAALGFAVLFLLVAVAGGARTVHALKRMRPLRQTVDTVKEDVEWAKQQLTRDAK